MKKIINLHVHSHYSILDSLSTTQQIIGKTLENDLPGVAITDHGNLNNYGHFYLEAREAGIKPILGVEFYFLNSIKKWKEKKEEADNNKKITIKERKQIVKDISKRYHLILLAKNKKGFENLNLLIHESYKNFYHRPRIDRKMLVKYSEGLICSSACIGGEVQQAVLQKKDPKYIDKLVNFYKYLFGGDYYLELQINEMEDQKMCNQELIKLSRKHKIKKILTGDSHYTNLEDQKAHQTLLLMNSKSTYEDLKNKKMGDMNSGAWEFDTKRLYLKNYDEYNKDRTELDPDIEDKVFDKMCENTFEIFEKIENYEIDNSVKLKDTNPDIKDKSNQLKINCFKKLEELKLHKNKKYVERLEFELNVIKQKELEDYFFVVKSIVDHAKNNMGMLVGPGRGSSSGSIVSYLMEITQIDPLRYGLYFERFLDVERQDYADIDIDFEDNDKIKKWILEEYKDEAACISSYSTFHLFGLIKDLGRTYGIEDAKYWNGITKIIRSELSMVDDININEITYDQAVENSSSFKKLMKTHKDDIAFDMKILMGKYRHVGKHAAGLIISENLIKNQPIMIIKGENQTSLTEGMQDTTLSKFGFIKIDFLGLKTLKVIHEAINIISKGKKESKLRILNHIHPDNIDLKSKKVFEQIFKTKKLSGIFQFNTDSANQVINKIKPETFEDLVAINALNRPGPKQFIDLYADRKHKVKKVTYNHELLKPILKETQGIILYQEQVMEIAKQLAGYTLPEANNLRKAMGKKIEKLMQEHKGKFINGCIKNNIPKEIAKNLFDKIKEFALYSFNKAHSVSYSMIGYQCAYLKTLHPIEFYTALLKVEEKEEKIDKIIKEISDSGIKINSLNISKSKKNFSIIDGEIYYGFSNIKGIGEKAADTIVKARRKKDITGFKDFLLNEHIDRRVCNKKVIENLIQSFVFGKNIEDKMEFFSIFHELSNKAKNKPMKEKYEECKNNFMYLKKANELGIKYLNDSEKVELEKKLYGTNLIFSCFDINNRREKINKLLKRKTAGGFKDRYDYFVVQFKNVSVVQDKNNKSMAFLDVEDIFGATKPGIIFASNFKEETVIENEVYCIKGIMGDKFLIDTNKNIDGLFA